MTISSPRSYHPEAAEGPCRTWSYLAVALPAVRGQVALAAGGQRTTPAALEDADRDLRDLPDAELLGLLLAGGRTTDDLAPMKCWQWMIRLVSL
jgi:hypothetical protein